MELRFRTWPGDSLAVEVPVRGGGLAVSEVHPLAVKHFPKLFIACEGFRIEREQFHDPCND